MTDKAQPLTPAQVVDLAAERARRQAPPPPRPAPGWRVGGLLAAAGIAVAVVAGLGQSLARPAPDMVGGAGGLVARGDLAQALQTQGAGSPDSRAAIRIGFSVPAAGGGYCRTFLDRAAGLAGLACRRAGAWRIDIAVAIGGARPGDPAWRSAGEAIPAPVLNAAQQAAAGPALDAAQEAQARSRGWR